MAVVLMVRFGRLSGVIRCYAVDWIVRRTMSLCKCEESKRRCRFCNGACSSRLVRRGGRAPAAPRSAGRASELQHEPELETAEPDVIRRDPGAFASQHRVAVGRGERRDRIG